MISPGRATKKLQIFVTNITYFWVYVYIQIHFSTFQLFYKEFNWFYNQEVGSKQWFFFNIYAVGFDILHVIWDLTLK